VCKLPARAGGVNYLCDKMEGVMPIRQRLTIYCISFTLLATHNHAFYTLLVLG
jgi:hypothetical protein